MTRSVWAPWQWTKPVSHCLRPSLLYIRLFSVLVWTWDVTSWSPVSSLVTWHDLQRPVWTTHVQLLHLRYQYKDGNSPTSCRTCTEDTLQLLEQTPCSESEQRNKPWMIRVIFCCKTYLGEASWIRPWKPSQLRMSRKTSSSAAGCILNTRREAGEPLENNCSLNWVP